MANWLADVGLPPGVVNVITGFGETCGAPLVQHADVNKIAFTGSAAVGKIIVKQAADTIKRVTLELGGKSPNIFFADADFEAAIDGALFGVFINQGEVCSAGRATVSPPPRRLFELIVDRIKMMAGIGPGNEEGRQTGRIEVGIDIPHHLDVVVSPGDEGPEVTLTFPFPLPERVETT